MKLFPRVNTMALIDLRGRMKRPHEPPVNAPVSSPGPIVFRDSRRTDEAVPFALRVAAGVGWRVIVVAIVLYGLAMVFGRTSMVVIPVGIALLLTALLMPPVILLNHVLRFPRKVASLVVLLSSLALVVGLLYVAGNQIFLDMRRLTANVEAGLMQLQAWLITEVPFEIGVDQINEALNQGLLWVQDNIQGLTSGAVTAGMTAGTMAVGTLMTLVAIFFFLADGDRIWSWLVRLIPREIRVPVHEAGRRGWVTLSSYVKTQVVVAAVDAVFIGLGAWALGLPLVLPIALIVFFFGAIPILGAFLSGALAVLVALVSQGWVVALVMLGIVVLVQQLESNVLQPLLMSKAVSLHPLATILGVAVFTYLIGIVGALFAVPIMAVTNTVLLYLTGHDKFPMLAHGGSALTTSVRELSQAPRTTETVAPEDTRRIGSVTPAFLIAEQRAREEVAAAAATEAELEKGTGSTALTSPEPTAEPGGGDAAATETPAPSAPRATSAEGSGDASPPGPSR